MAKLYRVLREPDRLAGFSLCRHNRGDGTKKHGRAAGRSSRGGDASQECPTFETFRFVLIHFCFGFIHYGVPWRNSNQTAAVVRIIMGAAARAVHVTRRAKTCLRIFPLYLSPGSIHPTAPVRAWQRS